MKINFISGIFFIIMCFLLFIFGLSDNPSIFLIKLLSESTKVFFGIFLGSFFVEDEN
jgi:hypothetical protein